MKNMKLNIADELYNEIEKAGYVDEEGCYRKYNNEDLSLDDFISLFFKHNHISDYAITSTDAFESPAYDCEVLSVAWIEECVLQLETFLIESV
jgi:hypothetical protein